jgi:hypothetical protein
MFRFGSRWVEAFANDEFMKIAGFFLLISGAVLVLTALVLLAAAAPRAIFVASGMAVEVLGLVLVVRSHLPRETAH